MTLKQVEAFVWAATAANFLLAADRLHISHPPSRSGSPSSRLQLGRALFDRSGHRAVLSEAGASLLPPRAAHARARRRHALARRRESDGVRGHCRFGVGELAALTWLPDLVALTRSVHPELVLEASVDLGATLEQRLQAGELDFAVVAGYSSRSALVSEAIAEVRFAWTAAPQLVGQSRSVGARLLQETALVTMPPAAGPTRMLEHWLVENNLEVGRRITCNNLAAVASLIVAGAGIGLVPSGWLGRLAERGAVVELRSRPALPVLDYTFQRRRDDSRPLLARLRELVRQTVDFTKPGPLW